MHKLCSECLNKIINVIPESAETWLKMGETSKNILKRIYPEIDEARKDIIEFKQYAEERWKILGSRNLGLWSDNLVQKIWMNEDSIPTTQWVLFPVLGSLTERAAKAVALEAARISIIENIIHNFKEGGMNLKTFLATWALWEATKSAKASYEACVSRAPHGEITDDTSWHMTAMSRREIFKHKDYTTVRNLVATLATDPAALRDGTSWI